MTGLKFEGLSRFRLGQALRTEKGQDKHRRRPHRKSRNGCRACRAKRLKCDERRPLCTRCSSTDGCCVYDFPAKGRSFDPLTAAATEQIAPSPQGYSTLLTLGQHEAQIKNVLQHAYDNNEISSKLQRCMTPDIQVLHHFANTTCSTMLELIPTKTRMMNTFVPLATQNSSVMHSLLAISARHMMYLQPCEKAHQLAHAFHVQKATSLLRQYLSLPLSGHNIDLIISNCLMLNLVSFTYDKFKPTDSWVFAEDDTSQCSELLWVRMHAYASKMFQAISEHVDEGFLIPAFMRYAAEPFRPKSVADLTEVGADVIPASLREVFDITPTSSARNNPYYTPLRSVCRILDIKNSSERLYESALSFIGQIQHNFYLLLKRKDERALLIFAYWLALMYGMDLWWVSGRARNEVAAICMVLDKSADARIRTLLQFPAERFGYKLSPVIKDPCNIEIQDFVDDMILMHFKENRSSQNMRLGVQSRQYSI